MTLSPLGQRTLVMGILNVTPDSFSDGGLWTDQSAAVSHGLAMLRAGADIIDVGGESTRPGAHEVDVDTEVGRTAPVIHAILDAEPEAVVSIDTTKASVARAALDAGAVLVNDVSGLGLDPDMAPLVAERDAWVCIMHIQGTPRTMQRDPHYDDVVTDITSWLEARVELALKAGIRRERIIVDPGIGFGKTLEHNLEILRRLDEFRSLGFPILLGTSRKSFIGKLTGREAADRAFGTAATVALGIARGADIVRVHDVPEMVDVVRVADAIVRGRRARHAKEAKGAKKGSPRRGHEGL